MFKPFLVCGIVTTFVMLLLQTRLEYKKARVEKALTVLKERYFNNTSSISLTTAKAVATSQKKSSENKTKEISALRPVILYWYLPWGKYGKPVNKTLGPECGGCKVTDNRTWIGVKSTKAVIFHWNELNKTDLPKLKRRQDQYYVFYSVESPALVKSERLLMMKERNLKRYNKYFSLTMTVRRDGDVYYPYDTMYETAVKIKKKNTSLEELMKNKKHLATWFASNCNYTMGARRRFNLVQKLVNLGLDVDRRGKCFPEAAVVSNRSDYAGEVMLDFISKYKFYLAFENAHHCKDYITEKLYANSFLSGAVPIVYGARKQDYEAVIPKKSAIFVDDYADLGQLIDYIKYLDKNDTAYMEYFAWRLEDPEKFYGFNMATGECELCLKLTKSSSNEKGYKFANGRTELPTSKIIKSLDEWYYNEEDRKCVL